VVLLSSAAGQDFVYLEPPDIISPPILPPRELVLPPPAPLTTTDRFGTPNGAFKTIGASELFAPFKTENASFSFWCLNISVFKVGVDYAVSIGSLYDFNYQFSNENGANIITSDSLWHQLVLTLQGSSASIYIDGNLASTSAINTGGITSGGWFRWYLLPAPDYQLDAAIDDLNIWNTALSSSEVSQLYTLESAPEPSTYALLGIGAVGMLMVLRRKRTA